MIPQNIHKIEWFYNLFPDYVQLQKINITASTYNVPHGIHHSNNYMVFI